MRSIAQCRFHCNQCVLRLGCDANHDRSDPSYEVVGSGPCGLPPYVVMQSEESRDSSIGEMRARNGMPSSEKPI